MQTLMLKLYHFSVTVYEHKVCCHVCEVHTRDANIACVTGTSTCLPLKLFQYWMRINFITEWFWTNYCFLNFHFGQKIFVCLCNFQWALFSHMNSCCFLCRLYGVIVDRHVCMTNFLTYERKKIILYPVHKFYWCL